MLPRIPPWPSSAGHFAIANTWLISRGATAQFHRVHPICLLSCACARTDEEMICHSRIRFYVRNWLRSVMIIRELHSSTPLASSTFVESSKQAIRFCSLLSPRGILITYLLLQPKPSLRPTDRTRTPFANVAIRVGVGLRL